MADNEYITLTEKGRKIAEAVYERHTQLSDWFVFLSVDDKVAAEDSCRIEYVISTESFDATKNMSKAVIAVKY